MPLRNSAPELFTLHVGALQDAGMSPEVAQQMVGSLRAQTGAQQCLVCFEAVKPTRLKVQLPCGHCTCDECWKVPTDSRAIVCCMT